MPSTRRNRATTVATAVAIAAGALGLNLPSASAASAPAGVTQTHSRAAVRLAGHPLRVDRRLAHHSGRVVPAVHLVRSGDTLSELAARYHTTVSAIRAANHLPGNRIVAGKKLTIPPAAGPTDGTQSMPRTTGTGSAPRTQHVAGHSVTVRRGDTLSGIATSHHVSVSALRRANPTVHGTSIRPGQRLSIPGSAEHRTPTSTSHRSSHQHRQAQQHRPSQHRVKSTFAGRRYSQEVTRAAQSNKDALMNRGVPSRAAMQHMVATTAKAQGLDPKLAQAIAYQESGFDMRAVSPANAVGVMQMIPSSTQWTSRLAGRTLDPLNPQDNVLAGVLLIKANLNSTGGDVDKAVAGYYQGLGSIGSNGMYADTKAYVASVKQLMNRF